jgi:MSHA biogenesis protein MshP
MTLMHHKHHKHHKQRGFAAIAAIFLVVVLAALGGFMLTLSNTQHITTAQDVQGSRAYWAARAGLEWGIGRVAAAGACPMSPTTLPGGSATLDGGLTVSVDCTRETFTEGIATVNIYVLNATAKSSGAVGSVGYIERSLSASMEY